MKPMLLLAVALGAWPGAVAMAQDAATKADVAKAQTIVNQVCAACHGAAADVRETFSSSATSRR